MAITITPHNGALSIKTPYSAEFVSQLKQIVPQADRQYTGPAEKTWIVDAKHGQAVQKLIYSIWGQYVKLPPMPQAAKLVNHQLWCEYIGACKLRQDGSTSAYGNDGKGWNIVLPEKVLKVWFGEWVEDEGGASSQAQAQPPKPTTLYQALLITQAATATDIKAAYRRMARLVHPDVNKEPNAHEQFLSVQRAYEVLSDDLKRKRYDAGLALEATLKPATVYRPYWEDDDDWIPAMVAVTSPYGYRSPLRCGVLTVDADMKAGRVVVEKIHSWLDITNELDEVLVTSWNMDTNNYDRRWV
jgi:hypothetical protein